jgi:hypothetical protein
MPQRRVSPTCHHNIGQDQSDYQTVTKTPFPIVRHVIMDQSDDSTSIGESYDQCLISATETNTTFGVTLPTQCFHLPFVNRTLYHVSSLTEFRSHLSFVDIVTIFIHLSLM